MVEVIQSNIDQVRALFKEHKVKRAEIFGSAASEAFNSNSDIDILISFEKDIPLLDYADNYFSLKEKLEDLLNRKIDLVSSKSLKNPVLIENINKNKVSLYAA